MENAFIGIDIQAKIAKKIKTEKAGNLRAWNGVMNRCCEIFYLHSAHGDGF